MFKLNQRLWNWYLLLLC